jgi:hypothetical protein
MQYYINKDDLLDLGVILDDEAFEKLLNELNDKVATLVGEEILESLTPDDVSTLADMQEKVSDDEIGQWVVEHVPDYPEIIEDNTSVVLGDFVETSDLVPKSK